jgi:hypothetical protein
MAKQTKHIHLAIKFSDTLTSVDTVREHKVVLNETGYVWFGKLGSTLGKQNIKKLNGQIASGKVTYVFLIQKKGSEYQVSRGTVKEVSLNIPCDEDDHVPTYYEKQHILEQVNLWINLSRLVNVGVKGLSKYHTASSGKKEKSSIFKSMASMFILADGAGSDYF